MTSLKTILIAYLVGGVTFIPLIVCSVIFYIYRSLPEVDESGRIIQKSADPTGSQLEEDKEIEKEIHEQENERKIAEAALKSIEDQPATGLDAYMAGWLTVAREFNWQRTNGFSSEKGTTLNETAYTSIYKHLMDRKQSVATSPASPDAKAKPKPKKRFANTYFAILRHGNLFLYDSPEQMNVQQVIVLANHNIGLWPPDSPDGQLFIRRNAICLTPKRSKIIADELESLPGPPRNAYFLFSDNCPEKEDFYFAMLRASTRPARNQSNGDATGVRQSHPDPLIDAYPLRHEQDDMMRLIQTLHSSEAHMQSMWLNALLGRLFLALHKTDFFEEFIKTRMDTKLSRVRRPSFLGDIRVTKVHCGGSPPYFTNPKLKELNKDGLMTLAADLHYEGDFSIEIATKATLNFGSRFKTREVSLVLSVAFKSLDGRINLCIKPPPSNRIWYCFETMPKIRMVIEPVVSSRQITYSMVTRVIENRINDALRDSLVAPFMDDLAFYDTSEEHFRGGIWDRKMRQKPKADEVQEQVAPVPGSSPTSEIQDWEIPIATDLRHNPDNLSISSSVSLDNDRRSMYDDVPSSASQELKHRKNDIFAGSDEENLRRKRVSGAFSAASAPAIVGTDRVNIVVVDGQITTRHQDTTVSHYSSPVESPGLRSSSRSSIRSSFSRSESEKATSSNSLANNTSANSDITTAIDDYAKNVTNVGTKDGTQSRSDPSLTRSLASGANGGEERVSLSESVKKWSNRYFTSARKSASTRTSSAGMSSSNPTVLKEDQIQKRIIESRLARADEVLMNAPRPHTYPPDAVVSADLPDSTIQSEEDLNEGPPVFTASAPHHNPTLTSTQYGPTKMHIPSVAHTPSYVPLSTASLPTLQPVQPRPMSQSRRKLPSEDVDSVMGSSTLTTLSRSSSLTLTGSAPLPPPPSVSQYSQAPSEPHPYSPPKISVPTEHFIATPASLSEVPSPTTSPITSPPSSPSTTARRSSGIYDATLTHSYARRKPVRKPVAIPPETVATATTATTPTAIADTQTTSSIVPDVVELNDLSENAEEPEYTQVPDYERSSTPQPSPKQRSESDVAVAISSSPPTVASQDHYEMPPVSFVDLVDEGNSFGLGGYDFTTTHPEYSSSPTNSSSAGSMSWIERARSTREAVDADTEILSATQVMSSSDNATRNISQPEVSKEDAMPIGVSADTATVEPSEIKTLSEDAMEFGVALKDTDDLMSSA
ncbi:hypothetical protein V1525DRAFT_366969 [Lipomyces kononenkoae]|uniref:Uncharacterized protein n=1 Tax=Lipomyces kononenkoae TaxID=34357 RepID=A0ACC3STF7_LIPKO